MYSSWVGFSGQMHGQALFLGHRAKYTKSRDSGQVKVQIFSCVVARFNNAMLQPGHMTAFSAITSRQLHVCIGFPTWYNSCI